MNDIPSEILARLDEKLARLNSFRPLLQTPVDKLREQFELEMTYNSNAIEGNSLTQKKTFLVINEGLPPPQRSSGGQRPYRSAGVSL